ncbi:TauD/TfdA family dioxygenase [Bradyrhizobium sp. LHD-71]|uniref:TauD/TfdA dioxygenase family protein n=1 Tax=Bradyrhizobium sp. LHD-71 TaxID=3072141 RepID=UPI00280DA3CD|nr:TauD/TfdA family dioxygenase [Bradyrhizobium sp. LHD-71]MDQ8730228.1 TauD/TfdA family dioxygenase [Bradyrhizobium sp. LHD-71]
MTVTVNILGPGFVGEVMGVTSRLLDDSDILSSIHAAYLSHKVIVIRDFPIAADPLVRISELFGPADPHHVAAVRHPDQPKITILSNQDEPGRKPEMKKFGAGWHSDYSYMRRPSNATLLLGAEVPGEGGDTLFADTARAFDTLSDEMKRKIIGLKVRHEYRFTKDRTHPGARWNFLSEAEQAATPEVVHPLVIRHPETGAHCLFIAPSSVSGVKGIVGMDDAESDALLAGLFAHMTSERLVYRHKWRPGDLVIWDNRSTIHSATTDQLPSHQVRRMYRITTNGSEPLAA